MSFKLKTILLFLGVSLIPYALTMILLGNSFRQEQYNAITQELNTQLSLTVERIDQTLQTLQNDMNFIAKSEVMNDIYTQDLDRRISSTLLSKKNDMKMSGDFYVIAPNGVIIASSDFAAIAQTKKLKPFFEIPIISSFTQIQIAKLIVTYPLENFRPFFSNTLERHYYIRHHDGTIALRPKIFEESLSVTRPLKNQPHLSVVLEEEKAFAYRLLTKYEQWFVILLIVGALFIAIAAYYVATGLIRPVIALSDTAKKITLTQDYTQQVSVDRDDEIGQLSDAFNKMINGMDALNHEIEDTQREVVFTMGAIGESRSKETGNHVKRVAEYSKLLAFYYGLDSEETEMLKQASPMHDIGKVAIPDAVLNKPGRFNEEERRIMDTHAALGYDMLKHSNRELLEAAAIVAYEHHEKWNGTGYPRRLSGEEIHIYGRITALADVFDALGSDRVYKSAWDDEKIFTLFKEERGEHFDPHLIDIFFDHLEEFIAIRETFKDIHES